MTCNVRQNTINTLKEKKIIDDNLFVISPLFWEENRKFSNLARTKYKVQNQGLLFSTETTRNDKVKAIPNEVFFKELQQRFDVQNLEVPSIGSKDNLEYQLKVIDIVSKNIEKINDWYKKIGNTGVFWNKLQQDLQIPKEQVELLKESEGTNIEEKLASFVANYSFTVQIDIISTREYANMTVPGGTNYTENEISIPGQLVEEKPQGVSVKPGVQELFDSNPELANIGTPQQYSEYLKTIFPNSKVKGIVYHGSNNSFDKFDKQYIGKNDAVSGYGFYFSHFIESARIFGKPVAALINLKRPSKKSLGYGELIDKESYYDLPLELRDEYKLIEDGKYKGYYEINLDVNRVPNESWDDFTLRLSKAAYDNVKKKYDGVYFGEKAEDIDDDRDIVVFEPEQIHILGSKQDIEGFNKWIKSNTKTERKNAIVPSIKGHAQFSTDNGIGWFRSDDKHPFTGFLEDLIASGTIKKVSCE